MKQNTILIAVIALIIGGAVGYMLANEHNDYDMPGMMHEHNDENHHDNDGDVMPMGNMGSMDHSVMMVSSEKEFIAGMIPHHQEAVNTAREVLERGGTTEGIRTLATNIISDQEKEITAMKQWYRDWYGEEYKDSGTYQPMMRELKDLSGAELDKVFLEDMIMHHMGAIMMAESVQPYIEHKEVADLSAAIKVTQAKEIDLMKDLLRELK